jgi:hypothetical protein
MRKLILLLFFVSGSAAYADGLPNCSFPHPERYGFVQGQMPLAKPGENFLEDLHACDPTLAAAVQDAVRYDIQKDETAKFVKQKQYVIGAYAVLWTILIAFALFMWARQQRLLGEIKSLEAKVSAAEKAA